MQGAQGMEEAGPQAKLRDPSPPRPQATLPPAKSFYLSTLCPSPLLNPPDPRSAPALLVRSPSLRRLKSRALAPQLLGGRQLRLFGLSVTPRSRDPRATPLSSCMRGPPTAVPGGGCRSPSAIFSVRSRHGCSLFPLTVYHTFPQLHQEEK